MPAAALELPAGTTSACLDANAVVDFLQDRLTAGVRDAFEAHVDRCPPCRRVLSAMAQAQSQPATGAIRAAGSQPGSRDGFVPVGETVDRYVIRGAIGAGSMGVVYAARDPALERDVAIKVVKVADGEDAAVAGARLLGEARALARLSHPNVVAVYDAGTQGDDMFIALELFDGPNLRDWLRAVPRRRAEIVDVLLAAGRGLAAAHAAGVIHRDVKPDNVVIARSGRVAVADFGLAVPDARAAALDEVRAFAGTPAYMSPEQLWSRPSGPASDQFSFAVMAHEALLGVHPFTGRTIEERRRAVRDGPLRMRGPLARVLRRALRVDPTARYPSLDALLDALARAARGDRRRRCTLALAVTALAIAAGVLHSAVDEARPSGTVDARCSAPGIVAPGATDGAR